jgi:uncharacterized protein (DUF1330 family)
MPAYVISEVSLGHADDVAAYRPLARESILAHGGTYLARDAVPEALEGAFEPTQRIVIVRFETVDDARAWYSSPAYAKALAAANNALQRRLFIVEGL